MHADRSIKAAQLADQIRDYLAAWTLRDLQGYFFSLTQVTLTPDLRHATVWVEVLDQSAAAPIMQKLGKLTAAYGHKLRGQLQRRIAPDIEFKLDDRPSIEQRFDELLK